jgi:lipoprotein-anchoring transpeptidase ErfK/SrfK
MSNLSRRDVFMGLACLGLAGCADSARFADSYAQPEPPAPLPIKPELDEALPDTAYVPPHNAPYAGLEAPGTIIVANNSFDLVLVGAQGYARYYKVGLGRLNADVDDGINKIIPPGSQFRIGMKKMLPDWHPPKVMRERELAKYGRVLPEVMYGGDPRNPLGEAALYLYDGKNPSEFRIHGTTEPNTIGTNISSGCIRLRNEDILDLYANVQLGAPVKIVSTLFAPGPAYSSVPRARL